MNVLQWGRVVPLSGSVALPQPDVNTKQTCARGHLVDVVITDAAMRARDIIANAEAEASARLVQFEQQVVHLRAELEASTAAKAEENFMHKCFELSTLRGHLVEQARPTIVAVASLLAERIVAEELLLKPERIVELAERAISEARGAKAMILHVAPEYATLLNDQLEKLTAIAGTNIQALADDSLGPGDLRIETDVGSVDARVSTQLSHLASIVVESMRK